MKRIKLDTDASFGLRMAKLQGDFVNWGRVIETLLLWKLGEITKDQACQLLTRSGKPISHGQLDKLKRDFVATFRARNTDE